MGVAKVLFYKLKYSIFPWKGDKLIIITDGRDDSGRLHGFKKGDIVKYVSFYLPLWANTDIEPAPFLVVPLKSDKSSKQLIRRSDFRVLTTKEYNNLIGIR